MATLKWKASNLYSTTNSTETNSTSILPTSAVTYALAQSINEMGDGDMYACAAVKDTISMSSGTSGATVNTSTTIPSISGYTPIGVIMVYESNYISGKYTIGYSAYIQGIASYISGNTCYITITQGTFSSEYKLTYIAEILYKKD